MIYSIFGSCSQKTNKGFTLIELLVAVAVSSIVLLAIGQFFISTNRTNTIQEKVAGTQQSIRAVMEMMTRDIRMAGLDPSGDASNEGFANNSGGDGVTDQNSIALRYDYDGDGTCEVDVSYRLDSTNETVDFRDGAGNNFYALTEPGTIDSLTFEYTLDDGSTPSDPSVSQLDDIRVVRITICGKIAGAYSDSTNPKTYCFSNTVKPRNL